MSVFSLKPLIVVTLILIAIAGTRASLDVVNCSRHSPHLPSAISEPIKYDINLTISPYSNFIMGKMDITINVKTFTKKIMLHTRKTELNINQIIIKRTDIQESAVNKLQFYTICENIEVLNLVFYKSLSPGQHLLHLDYYTIITKYTDIYSYPYIINNVTGKWWFTNLYAQNSIRGLFPCWDEPKIKASFRISIEHPKQYQYIVSNFPMLNQSLFNYNMLLTNFPEMPSMPTYHLAFAMFGDIVNQSSLNQRMWYKPNIANKIKLALEVAQYITLEISSKTSILMSAIRNVNHIILPYDLMKSMRRPGLIIYREKDVTFNNSMDMLGQHINVIKLMTYETTLQWFDRLATPYRYSDTWIHKILSSFYSYYVPSKCCFQLWEEERFMELFVVQSVQLALNYGDTLESFMHKVKDINEIDALFRRLQYHKKGAAIIHMMFNLVNSKKFEEAVSIYLRSPTMNIWTNLEYVYPLKTISGYTVKEIMDTWLTTKNYPELYVIRNFGDTTAQCYATYRDEEMKMSNWQIPIFYIRQSDLMSDYTPNVTWYQWPNNKSITDIDPDDFIIINTGHIGYYRVNYDRNNWYRISAFLQFDNFSQISTSDRAQLINNVYYFTLYGNLDISIFLSIVRYLKWDKDFIVWHPMFNIFSYMSNFFEYPESYLVKTYFVAILDGIVKNDDYEFQYYDDKTMPKALRMLAIKWACKLGHTGCRKAANAKLIAYLKNEDKAKIPSIWEDWVFCTGMILANDTTWNIVLEKSIRHKDIKRFEYLSCSDDEAIISYYLYYLYFINKDDLEKQGIPVKDIFLSVLKKHVRRNVLLTYVLQNYNAIKMRLFEGRNDKIFLYTIIMNVYSTKQLDQMEYFVKYNFKDCHDTNVLCPHLLSDMIDTIRRRRAQIQKIMNTFKKF